MPKLKCNVYQCKYNYDSLCSRNNIDVGGMGSTCKTNTCCTNFEYRDNSQYLEEFAKLGEKPALQTEVYCDVVNCVFERGQKCYADKVVIKNVENTNLPFTSSAVTHCQTFESKD